MTSGFYLIPERMKLWTNWRWKSRKANSSGETARSVPAEMTEKLTPDSGAPKIERPTVTGRVSVELVMITGQRKLFQ